MDTQQCTLVSEYCHNIAEAQMEADKVVHGIQIPLLKAVGEIPSIYFYQLLRRLNLFRDSDHRLMALTVITNYIACECDVLALWIPHMENAKHRQSFRWKGGDPRKFLVRLGEEWDYAITLLAHNRYASENGIQLLQYICRELKNSLELLSHYEVREEKLNSTVLQLEYELDQIVEEKRKSDSHWEQLSKESGIDFACSPGTCLNSSEPPQCDELTNIVKSTDDLVFDRSSSVSGFPRSFDIELIPEGQQKMKIFNCRKKNNILKTSSLNVAPMLNNDVTPMLNHDITPTLKYDVTPTLKHALVNTPARSITIKLPLLRSVPVQQATPSLLDRVHRLNTVSTPDVAAFMDVVEDELCDGAAVVGDTVKGVEKPVNQTCDALIKPVFDTGSRTSHINCITGVTSVSRSMADSSCNTCANVASVTRLGVSSGSFKLPDNSSESTQDGDYSPSSKDGDIQIAKPVVPQRSAECGGLSPEGPLPAGRHPVYTDPVKKFGVFGGLKSLNGSLARSEKLLDLRGLLERRRRKGAAPLVGPLHSSTNSPRGRHPYKVSPLKTRSLIRKPGVEFSVGKENSNAFSVMMCLKSPDTVIVID